MNFKQDFLRLTEYTTPYGNESDFESFLSGRIPDLMKDGIGNYHKIIGESETLFTCHLDNYCKEKVKVNHAIDENIIGTDGTTILGADNKAGVLVLLYLISNNVPGHYCFFIGEEPILSGGCYGSYLFAHGYKDITKFKRAIAFDRKQTGSIVTRQMAQWCCSEDFAITLANKFAECGVWMETDPTGYYTDTSSFLEYIPECTNISVGVWGEHTHQEFVDLDYVKEVAFAASKIEWETLPTVREPIPWLFEEADEPFVLENLSEDQVEKYKNDLTLFNLMSSSLGVFNFLNMNKTSFRPGKKMTFNHWFKEFFISLFIKDGRIKIEQYDVRYDCTEDGSQFVIDEGYLKQIILACKNDLLVND